MMSRHTGPITSRLPFEERMYQMYLEGESLDTFPIALVDDTPQSGRYNTAKKEPN